MKSVLAKLNKSQVWCIILWRWYLGHLTIFLKILESWRKPGSDFCSSSMKTFLFFRSLEIIRYYCTLLVYSQEPSRFNIIIKPVISTLTVPLPMPPFLLWVKKVPQYCSGHKRYPLSLHFCHQSRLCGRSLLWLFWIKYSRRII